MLSATWPAAADEVVTLNYVRAGGGPFIDQRYVLISDDDPEFSMPAPRATLLLLVGGSGKLNIANGELGINSNNFLTRTRHLFAGVGQFNIALMDAASDFLAMAGGLRFNRLTPEYLEDMGRVVADLRLRFPGAPVYVVGTSRGTIGAAFLAASLLPPAGPDGLVLTSSVTQPSGGGGHISLAPPYTIDLSTIGVPALVVAHQNDGCFVTPPTDAEPLAKLLKHSSAPVVSLTIMMGGLMPLSTNACKPLNAHGYYGAEYETVKAISGWIHSQLP